MIVMRLVRGAHSHFVTRMPEWGLSLILLGFASQLVVHSDSFESPGASAYAVILPYVSQAAWGCCAMAIAATWLLALAVNGIAAITRRWTPWVRSLCGLAAALFWGINAMAFFVVAPHAPGLVNNAGHAFLALASAIISAREVGIADRKARACRQNLPTIG